MKGTALHEVLAVENGLAETANRITKEVSKTLGQKQSIFQGMSKSHEIFDDEKQHLVKAPEYKEIQSTVDEQLNFLGQNLAPYWDISLQKEEANQRARADIIVGDTVVASNVPSIILLGMEKKLSALIEVYNAIPTLDAATAWEEDPSNAKPNVYRTKYITERQHTVVTKNWIEASPATKEFKAQLFQQDETEIIGKYIETNFSGAITSHEKARRLKNLTALIRGVKQARQRANATEVDTTLKFGEALLSFINS